MGPSMRNPQDVFSQTMSDVGHGIQGVLSSVAMTGSELGTRKGHCEGRPVAVYANRGL
ncbi:hypothetical protein [Vaccinia virus]|uniref:Uncharacterized protein n=1 Tax=Vaccinia virus TaxID=10245 RepID=A0A160NBF4_VACCV|nr:hypothetical protein [Vaccinia virus]